MALMRGLLLVLVVIGALAAQAEAGAETKAAPADDKPPRVAVVVQLAVNVDDARADALGGALADALARVLVVDAIGGSDVSRRMPPAGIAEDCVTTPACLNDLGERLDADQLLFVVIVAVGEELQIDPTWTDVATGRSLSRPKVTLAADAEAGATFAGVAQRLLPDAKIREQAVGGNTLIFGGRRTREIPRRMTTPAWIAGGAGIAAMGGAIGFGISTRATYKRCLDEECSDATLDSQHRRAVVADVCLGLTVAAAITTAALWWTSGGETVAVGVQPDGATVSLGGHF